MSKLYISHRDGSILFLALWALCILSIFAVALGSKISQQINLAEYFKNKPAARYLAEAAIKRAQGIISEEKNAFDSLNEPWSSGRYGDGDMSVLNEIDFGDGTYSARITDEERKININTATRGVLEALLMQKAGGGEYEASYIANSIIDWRDADNVPLEGGAEEEHYLSLEKPHRPKNGKFEVIEELLLVKGISPEVFSKIRGLITVYGDGRVNINTANRDVLCALGLDAESADRIISFRDGADRIEGTEDDNALKDPSTIVNDIRLGAGLDQAGINRLIEIVSRGILAVNSTNFMVEAEGRIGRRTERIICVTDKGKNIEYWRE